MSDGATPPASRQGDPTDLLGAVTTAQPQTSGDTTQQTSGTPDGNGHKNKHRHQPRGGHG